MRFPIVAGPLRGRWWLPQSRGKILRILGGTYEPEQTRLFGEYVNAGGTVFDVGAHVGYYTVLSAVLAGVSGRVRSFEPDPANHDFLRRHVALNRLDNVVIENVAVSDSNGVATFAFGTGSGTGRLSAEGTIEVRTVRLDDYCREHDVAPGVMKIDVEGAELDVLRGAEQTIQAHRPVIFLSTHGKAIHARCLEWLRERSYDLRAIDGETLESASEVLCT